MLSRGVVFGCFAEAMTLYHAIYQDAQLELAGQNWFVVDDTRMAQIQAAFAEVGFTAPAPRCFGKAVRNFDLTLAALTSAPQRGYGIKTPKLLPRPGVEPMASR